MCNEYSANVPEDEAHFFYGYKINESLRSGILNSNYGNYKIYPVKKK